MTREEQAEDTAVRKTMENNARLLWENDLARV